LDDAAVTVRFVAGVWMSPIVKARAPVELFVAIVWSAILEIVGGVFGAFTVSRNVSVAVSPPASATVRVIVVDPD